MTSPIATTKETPITTDVSPEIRKPIEYGLVAPESDAQARHWSIVESVGKRVTALQETIRSIQPGPKLAEALGQLRSLSHERSRLLRPAVLKSVLLNKNEELRKAATALFGEKFEKNEQDFIESIAPKDLIKLEAIERGVLAKFYAFRESEDESGQRLDEPVDIKTIKEGDTIRIDFGRNHKANAKIGAGDILPARVNVVKIIDTNGNIRLGRRAIVGGHIGYYDVNGKYLPIFNGYRIRIPTESETKGGEYKALGAASVLMNDEKEIAKLEAAEKTALVAFHDRLEMNEKTDAISSKVSDLKARAGKSGTYQEQIKAAIRLGESESKAMESKTDEASKAEYALLRLAVERLKNTDKIFEGKDVKGLDIDRYKQTVAAHESGGMSYYARNDDYGKKHNIDPEKWAFGKYQFITQTLRGYGVDLGRPPEESKIQAFLADSTLQERIMDQYVSDLLTKHILNNPKVMSDVGEGKTSIVYYLALAHNGGPGAIKNGGTANDYMSGKSAASYARTIADRYESGPDTSFLARLGRPTRTEAWAEKTNPEALIAGAYKHLGEGYKWGGTGESGNGIDCSGLVVSSLQQAGVVSSSYDNTAAGFYNQSYIKTPQEVQRGDLVFLQDGNRITHVEIALGPVQNGQIPILDASGKGNANKVSERFQKITSRVIVGTPPFYS